MTSDPYVASTELKKPVDDSLPVVREALRSFATTRITDPNPEVRAKFAEDIETFINVQVSKSGMRVKNIEVTELWTRPLRPTTSGAN